MGELWLVILTTASPSCCPRQSGWEARAARSVRDIISGGSKPSSSPCAWIAWTQCHLVGLSPGSTVSLPPRRTGKGFLWGGSDKDVGQAELTLKSCCKILCQVSTSASKEKKKKPSKTKGCRLLILQLLLFFTTLFLLFVHLWL